MASFRIYLKALRLPFLTGSLLPVTVATALAYWLHQTFNLGFFCLTLLGVAALHLGANLINDYYDAFGSDPLNRQLHPLQRRQPGDPEPGTERRNGQNPGLPLPGPGGGLRPGPDFPRPALGGGLGVPGPAGRLLLFRLAAGSLMSARPGGNPHLSGLRAAPHPGDLLRPDRQPRPGGRRGGPAPGLPHHRHHLDQRISGPGSGRGRGQAPPGGPPGPEACPAGSTPP